MTTPNQRPDIGQTHSITMLIRKLQSGDRKEFHDAAARIWARYFGDLLELARRRIAPGLRRRVDEQDVLQSMYKSFCIRQQRGQYTLRDRSDLWKLLVTITQNKASNAAALHKRLRRDVRREKQDTGAGDRDASVSAMIVCVEALEPSPAEAASMVEALQRRLEALDETQRRLALWKLAGYTNEEIASEKMMDCAVRTVERKLALIRKRWECEDQLERLISHA